MLIFCSEIIKHQLTFLCVIQYPAEEINLNICTHINYAFSILVNGTIHLGNPEHDVGAQGMIPRTIALRKYNPHLTIMISLGGWGEGSTKYSEMVRTEAGRKGFVKSVVDFIAKYDFDGVDLDWWANTFTTDLVIRFCDTVFVFCVGCREYPGWSGNGGDDRTVGRAEDKADYITLLKELRAAFKPHDYLLTAAIAAGKTEIDRAYELAEVSKNLDFLNVMSYDYQVFPRSFSTCLDIFTPKCWNVSGSLVIRHGPPFGSVSGPKANAEESRVDDSIYHWLLYQGTLSW